jgi:hypothetical protein
MLFPTKMNLRTLVSGPLQDYNLENRALKTRGSPQIQSRGYDLRVVARML